MSEFNVREIIPVELEVQTPDDVEMGNESLYRVIHAISPEANVQRVEGGAQLTVKDKDGTTQVVLTDGRTGDPGEKGDQGENGDPATIISQVNEYQVSESGTEIPSGAWSTVIPSVGQGYYLWARQTLTWNDNDHTQTVHYSISYQGIDGLGSVRYAFVNGQAYFPAADGGIDLGTLIREHQDISGKLDKNQGQANAGKFMKVSADGSLTPETADFVAKAQGSQYAGWHLEIDNSGNLAPAPYAPFMGTDGILPGQKGLVPAPATADKLKFLKGDGTWAAVPQQDISGKADKVSGATYGDLAKLDSHGNLVDSGIASADVVVKADIASKEWAPETGDTLLSFINSNCNFAALPFSFAKTGSAVPADTPTEIAGSMFTGICIGHDGYITVKIQAFSTTATQYTFERDYYQGTWRTNWASIGAALQADVNSTQDGVAIVAVGDTHDAISSGQFVFVRSHSTLAKGMYKATAAIAANGALSTSNLTEDGSGGLNDLQAQVTSLNSNIDNLFANENHGTFTPTRNGTMNLWTAPKDCVAFISVCCTHNKNGQYEIVELKLQSGGTSALLASGASGNGGGDMFGSVTVSCIHKLKAGDVVQVYTTFPSNAVIGTSYYAISY